MVAQNTATQAPAGAEAPKIKPQLRVVKTVKQLIDEIRQKLECLPDHPQGGKQVKGIAFHYGAHFDEVAALVIAIIKGEKMFPGLEETVTRLVARKGFQFWGKEERDPEWVLAQMKAGILPIGCGKIVDEHQPGLEKLTAAKVMAMIIGVENEPDLDELLSEVNQEDHHGSRSAYHTARQMKDDVKYKGVYFAIKRGFTDILERLRVASHYTDMAIQKYREWATAPPTPQQRVICKEITGPWTKREVKDENGNAVRDNKTGRSVVETVRMKYRLIAIQAPEPIPNNPDQPFSDLAKAVEKMPTAAMARVFNGQPGDNADIVILRWLGGQTQFFYKRRENRQIDFESVIRIVRWHEIVVRKNKGLIKEWPQLQQPWQELAIAGRVPEAPCWFCYKTTKDYYKTVRRGDRTYKEKHQREEPLWLFAGSLSHPEEEGPLQTLEQLVDATAVALDETFWWKPDECPKGEMCHHRDGEGQYCPYQRYGFRRCRRASWAAKMAKRDQNDSHSRSRPQRSDHRGNGNGHSHFSNGRQAPTEEEVKQLQARLAHA